MTRQTSRQFADFAFGLFVASIACQGGVAEQLVPLTELGTARYHGEAGGLYGNGLNEPPPIHRQLAKGAISKIQTLDAAGKTSRDGTIVLLSIGMSNTTQEFSAFVRLANQERRKRPELRLVDGAQGGADAIAWTGAGARSGRALKGDPWANVDAKLKAANVTAAQVQAIWVKQAIAGPAQYGDFPGHVRALKTR